MAEPSEGDRIAYIAISLYGNGSMSVSGNIADYKMACEMLENAKECLRQDWIKRNQNKIIIPNRDVDVHPNLPLIPHGDVASELRPRLSVKGIKQ